MPEYARHLNDANHGPTPLMRIRRVLRSCALHVAGIIRTHDSSPSLRLLFCHHVFDDQIAAFDAQIKWLASVGTFLTADEVVSIVEGRKPLDKRYFHLSFDDGFKNIITNALPVTKAYSIPATFFVPSAMIDAPYDAVANFCRQALGRRAPIELASWDDLARAHEAGLEVASHTRTHVRLSDISADQGRLRDEVAGSKSEIEQRLGVPCKYISWPYGRTTDIDDVALDAVIAAGYDACFSGVRGAVAARTTDRLNIPRHQFEPEYPMAHLRYFAQGGMEPTLS